MKRSIKSIVVIEEPEALVKKLKGEKDTRKKERLQMLYWIRTGFANTFLIIASLLGRSRSSITRWLEKYEAGGLESLLDIGTSSGRPSPLSVEMRQELTVKLSSSEGFASYAEIHNWLKKMYDLELTDDQLYYILKQLKASPKVARPKHYKQDKKEQEEFKEQFPQKIEQMKQEFKNKPNYTDKKPIKIWFQDESRFGLFTVKRRRITCQGVKPVGSMQNEYESCYLYGLVEPQTGDHFFIELPYFDAEGFQIFLDEFHQYDPDSYQIVFMDRAGVHRAKSLHIPDNIRLEKIPAYSPELNPIERVWQEIKNQIAWENFGSLDELIDSICQIVRNLSHQMIQSMTSYPYLAGAT